MGLFNKIFNSSLESKDEKKLPWKTLDSLLQLHDIEDASKTKTQVIFKYSTRCGVSRMVMNQFTEDFELSDNDLDLHYLDLISYREVSNEIVHRFQVNHESPQVLVIKNGVAVAHESHGSINAMDLNKFV